MWRGGIILRQIFNEGGGGEGGNSVLEDWAVPIIHSGQKGGISESQTAPIALLATCGGGKGIISVTSFQHGVSLSYVVGWATATGKYPFSSKRGYLQISNRYWTKPIALLATLCGGG